MTHLPFRLTQGDCDEDSECQGSLVCFQREIGQGVPGCEGVSLAKTDYCVKNIYAQDRQNVNGGNYIFNSQSDSNGQSNSANGQESGASQRTLILGSGISFALLSLLA